MIRTLGGIALISGCLLSLVYQGTYAAIQRNTEQRIRNAVLELLPGAVSQRELELMAPNADGVEQPHKIYAGYDATNQLVGVALEASDNNGYGGDIRLFYGYLPEEQRIIGMKVLLCKETPGLGDRIKTDAAFQANFAAMDVPLTPDGSGLAHPITLGSDGAPGQIDGISGATISSKAVVRAMRASTDALLPVIRTQLDALKKGGQ